MEILNNTLKLSYGPMTFFEFNKLRDDKEVVDCLDSTTIYVMARRELPLMKILDGAQDGVVIEVFFRNTDDRIVLKLFQSRNPSLLKDGIEAINLGNNTQDKDVFHSIQVFGKGMKFRFAANFDRLMHLHFNNIIDLEISGDITPFITYDVLYVGKCTKQHIFDRFKGHQTMLDILMSENIIPKDYDKVNDLVLLPFYIKGELISVIDHYTSEDEFNSAITGNIDITNETVSLDCEKALIKAMNPKYNKEKFKNYPKSKDGLYNRGLSVIEYEIDEAVMLRYDNENIIDGGALGSYSVISVIEGDESYIFNRNQRKIPHDYMKSGFCKDCEHESN